METKKDSIEEKNMGNDPEIRPVVDEGPSQLDEEPDVDQQESLSATEACDEGKLEDVTKSPDDKPKKKSTSVLDDSRLVWVLALTDWGREPTISGLFEENGLNVSEIGFI